MKKNIISVGAVESKELKVTLENVILNVTKGSLVVMKVIRDKSLYYLKGSTVTDFLTILVVLDVDATQVCHMGLGHTSVKSMQVLAKQGLLNGTETYKLKFYEHCVLGKKTKVTFGTASHHTKGILDYVHTDVWGP